MLMAQENYPPTEGFDMLKLAAVEGGRGTVVEAPAPSPRPNQNKSKNYN